MSVQEVATLTRGPGSLQGGMRDAAGNDERLLVAKARLGCESAFGQLYERHCMRIYHTAFRILRNAHDAEDAVQRSFQRAFTNLKRFRGDSAFPTWMTRIAMNEALMMLRQRRSNTPLFESVGDEDYESAVSNLTDNGPTPEEILAKNELRAVLMQAVSQLRKSLRCVVLRQLQGLTVTETARQLGLSVGAAKARGFHAKRYLRQHLERRLQATRNGFRLEGSDVRWTLFGSPRAER